MSNLVEYRMVHGDGRVTTETHPVAETHIIPRDGALWLWDHYVVSRVDGVLTAQWERVEDRRVDSPRGAGIYQCYGCERQVWMETSGHCWECRRWGAESTRPTFQAEPSRPTVRGMKTRPGHPDVPDLRTRGARVAEWVASGWLVVQVVIVLAIAAGGIYLGLLREGRIWGWW